MSARMNLVLIVFVLVAVTLNMTAFIVDEREKAVKLKFGEIVKTDFESGLYWKIPLVNTVSKFDSRIVTLDNRAEQFLTGEKKFVSVDFFVKWKVVNAENFYRAASGSERIASMRLLEIVKNGIKEGIAQRTIQQVVTAERSEIIGDMLAYAQTAADEFGIEIVDVRVKKIDLPDDVEEAQFERMRKERAREGARLRAEGSEAAERIRAEADRERTVILAEAYRESQTIMGQGDALAADVYAKAYGRDKEFYAFTRRLEAYRKSIQSGDMMVISPDSDFFRYFKDVAP